MFYFGNSGSLCLSNGQSLALDNGAPRPGNSWLFTAQGIQKLGNAR